MCRCPESCYAFVFWLDVLEIVVLTISTPPPPHTHTHTHAYTHIHTHTHTHRHLHTDTHACARAHARTLKTISETRKFAFWVFVSALQTDIQMTSRNFLPLIQGCPRGSCRCTVIAGSHAKYQVSLDSPGVVINEYYNSISSVQTPKSD